MRGRETTVWLAPLWLGACAFGSPCERGDWYGMGVHDGRKGAAPTAIDHRAAQCSLNPDAPSTEAYEAGRIAGLDVYCQPRRAFEAGRDGYDLDTACLDSDGSLASAYALGTEQRELRAVVARANAEIALLDGRHQKALDALERTRLQLGEALAAGSDERDAATRVQEIEQQIDRLAVALSDVRASQVAAAEALHAHRRAAARELAALD